MTTRGPGCPCSVRVGRRRKAAPLLALSIMSKMSNWSSLFNRHRSTRRSLFEDAGAWPDKLDTADDALSHQRFWPSARLRIPFITDTDFGVFVATTPSHHKTDSSLRGYKWS